MIMDEPYSYSESDCLNCFNYCGGKANVVEIESCTTRVRIELKDLSLADLEKLKTLPLVQGVWKRKTEVQLVIGFESYKIAKLLQSYLKIN